MDDEAREAEFDRYELMLIESVLSPSEVSSDGAKAIPDGTPSKSLRLKIGSAILVGDVPSSVVSVALTERECWALVERVNIFASIGPRGDVGLSIKRKLYGLLLAFDTAREVGEIGGASEHEERSAKEVRDALYQRGD